MRDKLADLAGRVKVTSTYGAKAAPADEWQQRAHGYRVTVRYGRRAMSFDYWHGPAITEAPEDRPADVLDSILMDARAGEESFEDFCSEFGYDADSRKAEATYRACQRMARMTQRVFGDDYARFAEAERD